VNRNALVALGVATVAFVVARPRASDDADEVEALARVVTSEANGYSERERVAVAWTVRNRARKRGTTIEAMVCSPTCGPCCQGRPFSSARAATDENRALAARVLAAAQWEDPTSGSTAFFEPALQDRLVAAGHGGYRFTSSELRERWRRDGQRRVGAVGAFEFWG
jgi:spore germination cell wall hydrolase CwlJ-like protein